MRQRLSPDGWAFTVRAHLLALVLGTLLPVLGLATVLVRRVVVDSRHAVEGRLLEAARAEAALVDTELSGTIRALQALAQSASLDSGDLSTFYSEARRLHATQQSWSMVLLHGSDGRNLLATSRPFGAVLPSVADPDSLARALATDQPLVGNMARGTSGRFAFPVRVPVMRDGRVRYVLSAVITPAALGTIVARQPSLSDEWVRGVADHNGIVVARSRDPERFVGRQGPAAFLTRYRSADEAVYRDISLDGRPVYTAFAHSAVSGWVAAVAVPDSAVESAFRQSALALTGFGLLLLGVGGGGAFFISRRISRDIARAATSADAIALGARPDLPVSNVAEVRQLTDALARSAALLDIRQAERDEHVTRADEARAQAEAADRAKDEFLAMLGHELRNPLAPVLTALQLMRLRGDTSGARERAIIERQVRHLVRLVDDLLDVSRLRRGRIELRSEPLELRRAIDKAVEISTPLVANHGHRLVVDVPAAGLGIDGDETRLAQVFVNLLNNAAKYADQPGLITLSACVDSDSDTVVVTCQDEGIGIDASLLPHVFDLFAQGRQSLDRRGGGLGLGLAVARTLIELHGGTIEARSEGQGLGSTFIIRLPRVPVTASDSGPVDLVTPLPGRSHRVLVVDDNHDAAEMLAETLRLAGCLVKVEHDGFEALKAMERFHADVCVLDIGLPTMDGFELARRLRAMEQARTIRLIAVTGYGQQTDLQASHAAGFDRHLVKPVSTESLLNAIRDGSVA